MMSGHRAFELYDRLRLAFSWESGIYIRDIAHVHQLAADVDQEVGGSSPPSCTS
jgi:hypothetical protein